MVPPYIGRQDPCLNCRNSCRGTRGDAGSQQGAGDAAGWVFLNGQWVQVQPTPPAGSPEEPSEDLDDLVTQRVIRVPVTPLLNGDSRINIVVRTGDMIRIPEIGVG